MSDQAQTPPEEAKLMLGLADGCLVIAIATKAEAAAGLVRSVELDEKRALIFFEGLLVAMLKTWPAIDLGSWP